MYKKNKKLDIFKIAFTGGPCAGKTTAITTLSEKLRGLGFVVLIVPEAATMIFQSGGKITFETFTENMQIRF